MRIPIAGTVREAAEKEVVEARGRDSPNVEAAARFREVTVLTVLVMMSISVSHAESDVPSCDEKNGLQPYCSFRAPEDMVRIPESALLIISQYGGFEDRGGSLVLFDTALERRSELYSADASKKSAVFRTRGRGEEICRASPQRFSPHGIGLGRTSNGELLLFVVNHGANESIEIFSLSVPRGTPTLRWQGCVLVGDNLRLNDVAALPGGGFVATANEYRNDFSVAAGYLLRWTQRTGLHDIATFPGKSVNGIETSSDGQYAFVNEDRDGRTTKILLETAKVIAQARIRTPDNSSWSQDGRLLLRLP